MERIKLHSLKNIRDISYGNIKEKRLIRSESLRHICFRDKKTLVEKYNLRVVIDLRTLPERNDNKDKEIKGVKNIHIPLIPIEETGVANEKEGRKEIIRTKRLPDIKDYYCRLVNRNRKEAWTKIFNTLLEVEEGAVLIHCTVGKDRSGIVDYMILRALGVTHEDALTDYLITNEHPIIPLVYRLFGHSIRDKELRTNFFEYFKAKEEYLFSALNYIDEVYGGVEQFLLENCDLTSEKRKHLEKLYLKED